MDHFTIAEGQSLKGIFGRMTNKEIAEMFNNTLLANDFRSMRIEQRAVVDDGEPRVTYVLVFEQNDPREEFPVDTQGEQE